MSKSLLGRSNEQPVNLHHVCIFVVQTGLHPQRVVPWHPVPAVVNVRAVPRPQLHHQSLSQRNVCRGLRKVKEGCQAERFQSTLGPL